MAGSYAFVVLDGDMDGLVAAETIDLYDMFQVRSELYCTVLCIVWRTYGCIEGGGAWCWGFGAQRKRRGRVL